MIRQTEEVLCTATLATLGFGGLIDMLVVLHKQI